MKQLIALFFLFSASQSFAGVGISYWNSTKAGANTFNKVPLSSRYQKAKGFGLSWLRIAPNKWLGGRVPSKRGDFLLGPKGTEYNGLNKKDLKILRTALDDAHKANIKIVLTTLSLPGNRWSQHNGGKQERKIWSDFRYHKQAAAFWRDLALALKDHPAIAAYNIKNEPCPERGPLKFNDWFTGNYKAWYQSVRGTPQDLNLFNKRIVESIRSVDPTTPIMIDAGFYATPWAFQVLEPLKDDSILYAFHMYEPYALVSHKNKKDFSYPGEIPTGETQSKRVTWNASTMSDFLEPVREFQRKHGIPSNRIVAAEFGISRKKTSALNYLRDQINIYKKEGWHWAFYSFREDDWDAMDYELGTAPAGAKYWEAVEKGEMPPDSVYNRKSVLWDLLKTQLSPE